MDSIWQEFELVSRIFNIYFTLSWIVGSIFVQSAMCKKYCKMVLVPMSNK